MKFLCSEKISEHKFKTPEGYLVCVDSVLARTGKQTYKRSEIFGCDCKDAENEVDVDRPAEEVFSDKTLASFENKPLTIEHPDEDVNTSNHRDLAVGFARDIKRGKDNGQDVMLGTLVFTDDNAIEAIENGDMVELSCGYDADIVDEENPCQRNIRGNHIALCQRGRAGNARIVDSKVKDSYYHFDTKDIFGGTHSVIVGAFSYASAEAKLKSQYPDWIIKNVWEASTREIELAKQKGLYIDSIKDDNSFKKGQKFKNANGAVVEIIESNDDNDYVHYTVNGRHNTVKSESLKNMLDFNGYSLQDSVKDEYRQGQTVKYKGMTAKVVKKLSEDEKKQLSYKLNPDAGDYYEIEIESRFGKDRQVVWANRLSDSIKDDALQKGKTYVAKSGATLKVVDYECSFSDYNGEASVIITYDYVSASGKKSGRAKANAHDFWKMLTDKSLTGDSIKDNLELPEDEDSSFMYRDAYGKEIIVTNWDGRSTFLIEHDGTEQQMTRKDVEYYLDRKGARFSRVLRDSVKDGHQEELAQSEYDKAKKRLNYLYEQRRKANLSGGGGMKFESEIAELEKKIDKLKRDFNYALGDSMKDADFSKQSKQGYQVIEMYRDAGRLHAILKRSNDFVIAYGYDTSDGTWAQGRYDFSTLERARQALQEEKKYAHRIADVSDYDEEDDDDLSNAEKELCDYMLENVYEKGMTPEQLLKKMESYYSMYQRLARHKPEDVKEYFREEIRYGKYDSLKDVDTSKEVSKNLKEQAKKEMKDFVNIYSSDIKVGTKYKKEDKIGTIIRLDPGQHAVVQYDDGKKYRIYIPDLVDDLRYSPRYRLVKDSKEDILQKIRTTQIREGDVFEMRDGQYLVQIQNVGKQTIEFKGNNWRVGHASIKESSWAWGRIWKNGTIVFNETDALNIVRDKMIQFLKTVRDSKGDK